MKRRLILLCFLIILFFLSGFAFSENQSRREIQIPDILGYQTLMCDLHMHTVFSDGTVWPTVRVKEAWLEGLDAIAITDHVEYLPHKEVVSSDLSQPYRLAKEDAEDIGLILIQGAEITRGMPPGHLNAIFMTDPNALKVDDWREAVQIATEQGAFLTWNHPGRIGNQKEGIARWYDEHTELFNKGWLHGIEIVNRGSFYPKALTWGLNKNLTILGGSDVHDPTNLVWDFAKGEHRPLTLVFAEEHSLKGIREALDRQRTAVYYGDTLIGTESYLEAILNESVEIRTPELTFRGKNGALLQIHNYSDIPYRLVRKTAPEGLSIPLELTLYPHKTVMLYLSATNEGLNGRRTLTLSYRVSNLWIAPEKALTVNLPVKAKFVPE